MNNHYNTIISDYAQAMYALRLKKVKSLVNQHPDCAVEVFQYGERTEVVLRSRLDVEELEVEGADIRDIADSIAAWSWPEYRYKEERVLYRLRNKVLVKLVVEAEQRLTGEEVSLLRDLGKYRTFTNEYKSLVC